MPHPLLEVLVQPPDLLFGLMLVQRHFDRRLQLAVVKRLEQIPIRFGPLGLVQRRVLGIGGQEYHRQLKTVPDFAGREDAIRLALQANVHQHQGGPLALGDGQRLLGRPRRTCPGIAQTLQPLLDVQGHDRFIFDNQDAS